jgi:hypothetical protein
MAVNGSESTYSDVEKVLMALMQSIIRRLPNSLYPTRRNPWQDMRCKGSLLKVREEKNKWKHVGAQ